jgi:hypothetical protein
LYHVADRGSEGGDSGSPVFLWDEYGSYVDLVGIHSAQIGDARYFSRWMHIVFELGWKLASMDVAY